MLHFELWANQRFVASSALRAVARKGLNREVPTDSLVAFAAAAKRLDLPGRRPALWGLSSLSATSWDAMQTELDQVKHFIQRATELDEFRPVLAETDESLVKLEDELRKDFGRAREWLSEIMGHEIMATVPVYLVHPGVLSGRYEDRGIIWAYRTDWPYYNLVYLCHEALHSLPCFEMEEDNEKQCCLRHAVIELIADNELRVRFNGGRYPPHIGHDYLYRERQRLLNPWRLYLARPSERRNIYAFLEESAA